MQKNYDKTIEKLLEEKYGEDFVVEKTWGYTISNENPISASCYSKKHPEMKFRASYDIEERKLGAYYYTDYARRVLSDHFSVIFKVIGCQSYVNVNLFEFDDGEDYEISSFASSEVTAEMILDECRFTELICGITVSDEIVDVEKSEALKAEVTRLYQHLMTYNSKLYMRIGLEQVPKEKFNACKEYSRSADVENLTTLENSYSMVRKGIIVCENGEITFPE